MNPTLDTLRQWSEAGWLRRLDSALAAFVAELDPQAQPALLVTTALLAHMEGRGHTCLPLAPLDWSGLSLVVGVSLAESLHPDLRLKWPNDLQSPDGRKVEHALLRAGDERRYAAGEVGRIKLGDATAVEVQQAGSTVDLAPYQRANVARFTVSSEGSLAPVGD